MPGVYQRREKPPDMLTPAFIILVVWAWVCVGNVIYFILKRRIRLKQNGRGVKKWPKVAVVEAVKGIETDFQDHLAALVTQDYPCYRLIFSLSHEQDPAHGFLREYFSVAEGETTWNRKGIEDRTRISPGLVSVDIVTGTRAVTCSQKIQNQRRAYETLTPEDETLAWVDADTQLSGTWLKDLVYPLLKRDHAASTGYRCLLPRDKDWVSALTSVMNASVLTCLGDEYRNSLWGGSMAMSRRTFGQYDISGYVSRCFSDDESVGALLKKNKVPVIFAFPVIPEGKIRYSFAQMFNFGRRQYTCARHYYKFHLFIAWLLLTGFSLAFWGLLAQIIFWQEATAAVLFAGLYTAMILRGLLRYAFIRFGLKRPEYNFKCLAFETVGTPVVHLIHLMICCSAMVGSRVEWAGITYTLKGPFDVTVH